MGTAAHRTFLQQADERPDAHCADGGRSGGPATGPFDPFIGATKAALEDIEASLKSGAGSTLAVSGQAVDGYTLLVTSKSTNTFSIVKASTGIVTRSCVRNNSKGGCPTSLAW